jgi:hypothetical protein
MRGSLNRRSLSAIRLGCGLTRSAAGGQSSYAAPRSPLHTDEILVSIQFTCSWQASKKTAKQLIKIHFVPSKTGEYEQVYQTNSEQVRFESVRHRFCNRELLQFHREWSIQLPAQPEMLAHGLLRTMSALPCFGWSVERGWKGPIDGHAFRDMRYLSGG